MYILIYFYLPRGFVYYFIYYIYIYYYLLNIWEHDISECSLWNISAQVQTLDLYMTSLTDHSLEPKNTHSCRGPLVGHTLRYYTLLLYLLLFLKARTYFWLVYFLYVGRFSPYLKAPANQKNQEISHLPENS